MSLKYKNQSNKIEKEIIIFLQMNLENFSGYENVINSCYIWIPERKGNRKNLCMSMYVKYHVLNHISCFG